MSNNRYTPRDIVGQRFCIPLYQRLFAWTPKEVRKLLTDLKEHFDSERFQKEHNAYYLGMLTVIVREGGDIDLIDGQQRFTVMILMAIAFKHIPEWNSFLEEGKRLKLVARSEDENYLMSLSNDDNLTDHLNIGISYYGYENLYMKNALLCITDYIERICG